MKLRKKTGKAILIAAAAAALFAEPCFAAAPAGPGYAAEQTVKTKKSQEEREAAKAERKALREAERAERKAEKKAARDAQKAAKKAEKKAARQEARKAEQEKKREERKAQRAEKQAEKRKERQEQKAQKQQGTGTQSGSTN